MASVEIFSLRLGDYHSSLSADFESLSVALETESDASLIEPSSSAPRSPSKPSASPSRSSFSNSRSSLSAPSSRRSDGLAFSLASVPVSLAVRYRSTTSLVIRFFTKEGTIKKKNVTRGIGLLRLADIPDGVRFEVGVPVWPTADLGVAMECAFGEAGERARPLKEIGTAVLEVRLQPGLSKAHSSLARRDARVASVVEGQR